MEIVYIKFRESIQQFIIDRDKSNKEVVKVLAAIINRKSHKLNHSEYLFCDYIKDHISSRKLNYDYAMKIVGKLLTDYKKCL